MISRVNKWLGSAAGLMFEALPVLLFIVFYQINVLQGPAEEVIRMLGWLMITALGLALIF